MFNYFLSVMQSACVTVPCHAVCYESVPCWRCSTMSCSQHVSLYHGEWYSTMSCCLLRKCTMLKVQYHVIQAVHTTVPCRKCSTVLFSQHN